MTLMFFLTMRKQKQQTLYAPHPYVNKPYTIITPPRHTIKTASKLILVGVSDRSGKASVQHPQ